MQIGTVGSQSGVKHGRHSGSEVASGAGCSQQHDLRSVFDYGLMEDTSVRHCPVGAEALVGCDQHDIGPEYGCFIDSLIGFVGGNEGGDSPFQVRGQFACLGEELGGHGR
jgi:hypothetical protein